LKTQREAEVKKKEQQRKKKGNEQKKIQDIAYPQEHFIYEKKMTNDEIIEKGKIIRVKSMTLSAEDFRVEV
jgi:LAS superfamily LD-carboxypeptidase LdcB